MGKSVKVAVTGAAGQIGYALVFRIAAGDMFGKDTDIHLNLLELEKAMPALQGVVMELSDCAFPLLKTVHATSSPGVAFKDVDWALLVGSVPRRKGMERADLLKINANIFIEQGRALNKNAHPSTRVLVVGNPCNTNAYIAKETAKNIPDNNFFALTMLDQNRAVAQLAQKAGVSARDVKNMIIWGNHSLAQFPDFGNAMIGGKKAEDVIEDKAWLKTTFMETVQKRGAAIIQARGASSAASAANAVIDTARKMTTPTPQGECFSLAVCSDGSYGINKGLIFSFPVVSDGRKHKIVQGIQLSDFAKEGIERSRKELLQEKECIASLLHNA